MRQSKFKSLLFLLLFSVPAFGQQNIRVEITNLQATDGFYLTPLFTAFHDGNFDYFDANAMTSASMSLELLAEEGDASSLLSDVASAGGQGFVITDPAGFSAPPVIDPGNTAAAIFNIDSSNRFFSFGSMIIPSNDAFIGNDSGTEFEIFDINGNFSGPIEFTVLGSGLYDAGTEANDGLGAPFSANGGTSSDETEFVRSHPGLANFLGTNTAAGTTIGSDILAGTPIARIRIDAVPEPGSGLILLFGAAGFLVRRRRRK